MAKQALDQDSLAGRVLGHYRIVEQIGAGGMGVVYRARDEHLDRDVAIKILPPGLLADDKARQRFHKEAHILSKLNHPNIATVYDFDFCDGIDYLAEELVPCDPLDRMLSSTPLSETEIVNLGTQLCEGLAAAHTRGVLHRDIKPSNLLVAEDGQLKIVDFGLAQTTNVEGIAGDKQATLSAEQVVAGTLPYMSPEQLRNEKLDPRTDIWATGCVLYEIATGRRPFRGEGTPVINEILTQTPKPPSRLNHKISAGLEAIIQKCLEKDLALRYGSVHEITVDLHRLSAGATFAPATRRRRVVFKWKWSLIALVGLVLTALVIWRFGPWHPSDKVDPPSHVSPSIAVLPFVDMSPGKDQEYFADGLAEELLNDLAKMPELRVTARSSSFQFKGKNEDSRVIGEKLNVASVLEGSVRKQGDHVRITAELINASDGFHIWSETYDRNLKDVFAVQEEIARSVAGSLKVKLLGANAPAPQTTTPEAYNLYLQGRYFQEKNTKANLEKAMSYYQDVIRLDPAYAPAWAELSLARRARAGQNLVWPEVQGETNKARKEAEHALTLDSNLARAYTSLAYIKMVYDRDWDGANADFKRALASSPGDEQALGGAAMLNAILNRFDEALRMQRRAVELNPLSAGAYHGLGFIAWWAGRPEEATEAIQKALELDPEYPWLHTVLAYSRLAEGRPADALVEAQREKFDVFHLQNLALAYHALGRKQESNRALTQLVVTSPGACYQIAEVYAFRGQADEAIEWLERAYAQRDGGMTSIKGDPLLKNLERDPRYHALLQKMRLAG